MQPPPPPTQPVKTIGSVFRWLDEHSTGLLPIDLVPAALDELGIRNDSDLALAVISDFVSMEDGQEAANIDLAQFRSLVKALR